MPSQFNTALMCGALLAAAVPASAADLPPTAEPGKPLAVSICEDENEWPPYSYFLRVNGQKSRKLAGYAVDVIDDILTRHQISYRIDMIPWSRCLAVAKLGKQYQMVLNLSFSPERMQALLFSRPYYSTTVYYYYSKRHHADGLAIKGPADLRAHRLCGVRGYNYVGYGIDAKAIDQGAGDFTALIAKMHLGRCDMFLEKNEIMTGYGAIGRDYLADPDIGRAPMPGIKPGLFHFGVSRQFPQAEVLRSLIDQELVKMEDSGRLQELWTRATRLNKP
jgi:polar amino acid transport system substrate-binding protein